MKDARRSLKEVYKVCQLVLNYDCCTFLLLFVSITICSIFITLIPQVQWIMYAQQQITAQLTSIGEKAVKLAA